jgi:hypothetical protein
MIIAMPYAENTTVSPEKSRAEIERILQRYGASAFSYGWEGRRAVIMFRAADRHVKFELITPDPESFRRIPAGQRGAFGNRTDKQVQDRYDQAMRQRWRALTLVVKAKLEAVETGITTFEEEFLAHIVLPNGETFGQWAQPQIAEVYETGEMPRIVPGLQPLLTAGEDSDG